MGIVGNNRQFSVGFHNVQGMHNGVGCKVNEIQKELTSDIEILTETWGCKCNVVFENYISHHVSPQKHTWSKKGRKSGGFTILYKTYLKNRIKVLKSSNNFVWIEVEKNIIQNLQENFLVVATYINDVTSSYYKDEIFEELHRDILKFSGENIPILFMGDFNGRVGNLDDTYKDPKPVENSIPIISPFESIHDRRYCDTVVNSHGNKIIHLCHTFDFKILNGRIGDAIGNFTHLHSKKLGKGNDL